MKTNKKIIITAASLVLLSAVILGVALFFISNKTGDDKQFSEGDVPFESSEVKTNDFIYIPPESQADLEKKFGAMAKTYETSWGKKVIEPASKEFLSEYWKSNLEKEELKTLSIEEVMFIIQDSVRIYQEYDIVSFPEFYVETFNTEVKDRIPQYIQNHKNGFYTNTKASYSKDDYENITSHSKNISTIVFIRLRMLSSPCTFASENNKIAYIAGYTGEEDVKKALNGEISDRVLEFYNRGFTHELFCNGNTYFPTGAYVTPKVELSDLLKKDLPHSSEFEKVKQGMSYTEVVELLGPQQRYDNTAAIYSSTLFLPIKCEYLSSDGYTLTITYNYGSEPGCIAETKVSATTITKTADADAVWSMMMGVDLQPNRTDLPSSDEFAELIAKVAEYRKTYAIADRVLFSEFLEKVGAPQFYDYTPEVAILGDGTSFLQIATAKGVVYATSDGKYYFVHTGGSGTVDDANCYAFGIWEIKYPHN